MTGEFDVKRALRELIEGLRETSTSITAAAQRAEQQMSEAEATFNALTKVRAYVDGEIKSHVARLQEIVEKESEG